MTKETAFLKEKKVLVTGAGGFIGSTLCRILSDSGARVRGLSRRTFSPANQTCPEWLQRDVRSLETWKEALKDVEIVFHLAAQTSAAFADKNPGEDETLNVLPVKHLLQCAFPELTVIFAGTATQYGIPKSVPVDESHPEASLTIYDQHKQQAENLLLEASNDGRLKACSLRLCNIYGPGPAAGASDRGVLNQMISRAFNAQPLVLYSNADCIRDFLYVDDCALAFIKAAEKINTVKGKAYVIGSGEGHSIAEAAGKVANLVREKKIQPAVKIEQPFSSAVLMEIENRNFIADSSRFIRDTDWKPYYSLDRGIESMLENFLCIS